MKPRDLAEWEPLLLLGLVFTRASVSAPRRVKSAFHGMVATYIGLGWLDPPSSQLCVVCYQPAQEWHHPSYERGFHDVVQPTCHLCHSRHHNRALRRFAATSGTYLITHRQDIAGVVDATLDNIAAGDTGSGGAGN